MSVPVQVREHTSHLEAELEKHMAAASAECQNYAKEVAGVSDSVIPSPAPEWPLSQETRFSQGFLYCLSACQQEPKSWVFRLSPNTLQMSLWIDSPGHLGADFRKAAPRQGRGKAFFVRLAPHALAHISMWPLCLACCGHF